MNYNQSPLRIIDIAEIWRLCSVVLNLESASLSWLV